MRRRLSALLSQEGLLPWQDFAPDSLLESPRGPSPDVVVVGYDSTGHDQVRATKEIRRALPEARIVVVAAPTREHDVRLALRAGADGVVLDSEVAEALVPTVRAVLAGQLCLPRLLRRHAERPALSHREKQVLALMVTGVTNRQIGDALFLAESTVKSHLASAFSKLGVRSRAEATTVLADEADEAAPAVSTNGSDRPTAEVA